MGHEQMKEWGLQNVHLEKWPFGYGWQINISTQRWRVQSMLRLPVFAGLDAWKNGPITVEPVWPYPLQSDFAKYHGKLKARRC